MELIRRVLFAGVLVVALTGCTYTDQVETQESRRVEASTAATTPPAVSSAMQGEFQPLAAATTGTAVLEVNESGAVLQLDDMATEPGKDLRVMLSPGTLTDSAGGPELSSTRMIEIGPFRTGATQRFVMDSPMWSAMKEPVRSVLIYDYAAKSARGVAVLSDRK